MPVFSRPGHAALIGVLLVAGCVPYVSGVQPPTGASAHVDEFQRCAADGCSRLRQSWMLSEAAKKPLIYISTRESPFVYVYTDGGHLVGQLNIGMPQGECVDKAGNVWITDTSASRVVEYAHGGTKPIATLADQGEQPAGCSVDPSSGDLAVTNICNARSCGNGNVAVYKRAKGKRQSYFDPGINHYYSCAYDGDGNLLVNGSSSSSEKPYQHEIFYAQLHYGATKLRNITFAKSLKASQNVQWTGIHDAVQGFPNHETVIYHISVARNRAKVFGVTTLKRAAPIDFFIAHGELLSLSIVGIVSFYDYPSGKFRRSFVLNWFVKEPIALVVSGLST